MNMRDRSNGHIRIGIRDGGCSESVTIVDAHRKYDEIELKWSAREARFTIGKKSAISTRPLSAP